MPTTSKVRRVVVITKRGDAHLPFVEPYLDAPFILIDPQELLEKKLTFEFVDGQSCVIFDGERLDPVGVWYRKPVDLNPKDLPVDRQFLDYSLSAIQKHSDQLLAAFEDSVWVSSFYALKQANNKSLQLDLARRLGMKVPPAIITSDQNAAKAFLVAHPTSIVKPLGVAIPAIGGKRHAFFTTLIESGDNPDLRNLHLAPSIFQKAIHTVCDVRVTVIGEKVFPAKLYAKGVSQNTRVHDFRLGYYGGEVVAETFDDFPDDLAALCVAHTQTLGLHFGALDFVMDDKGIFWFLENNPNGQWAFVEKSTGQPIGKAMAALLQGDSK